MIVVGVVVLFFILANFIVLNDCASPCRNTAREVNIGKVKIRKEDIGACPDVCVKVTLLDWILGND